MTKTSDTDPKTLAERTEAVLRDATDRQVRCMSDVVGEPGASGQFLFAGRASIEHLNTRKVGEEDARELAVDVKFAIEMRASGLMFFHDASLLGALYLPGGAVRNVMLNPIGFANELEHYQITAVGSSFGGVKLKRFAIQAQDSYRLDVTFTASFMPSADEIARIAEYLDDEIDVVIAPENATLDLRRAA